MRITSILLVFLIGFCATAQNTITGTFSPAEDYSWIIAYRLKPGSQVYAADTVIKNGEFNLTLPENAPQGTYRLVYAIPQEEYFFDIIYNGKEEIKFTFDSTEGANFITSEENILFGTYFNEINTLERDIISFYSNGSTDVNAYNDLLKKFDKVQQSYEKRSKGLLVNQFIKANNPNVPSSYVSIQDYVKNRKRSYFKNLDVRNSVLQSSGFLSDKLANYVFTALPIEQLEKEETEKEIQLNITKVHEKLKDVSDTFRFHVFYSFWTQSSASGFNNTADFIFAKYLKPSSAAQNNKDIIDQIEIDTRLRISSLAPDLVWKDGDKKKRLSTLFGAKNYVLVFWSSTCGHCLKELPELHTKFKENTSVKVVAVGLENDEISWNIESAKLENFEHAISLGKWESEYAALYNIQSTPTYFILDENKYIIAKPENVNDVVSFFSER